MKTRKLALLLCLTMLFSILSPSMAFAAQLDPELPPDEPIGPDPYSYISQIDIDFIMYANGNTSDYCSAYVPHGYHYALTMELLKKSGNSWDVPATVTWITSGNGTVYLDKTFNGLSDGYYRLAVSVDVYDNDGLLCESVTEYSRIAYCSNGSVFYYWY